jgi:hypothetical protein
MRDTTPSITIVETFTHDIGFGSGEISPADHWERRPLADEAVCRVCGAVRLYVRAQLSGTRSACG